MASGLKARLAQISSQSQTPKPPPKRLHELGYVEHAQVADERLYRLDEVALRRIGLAGDWPGIERALFLDTETTGLSRGAGTVAFMIGLGYVKDGAFVVEQHTLGDYPDEPLMMSLLMRRLREYDVIVSFNGNAFDLPLLESRAVMCRMGNLFEDHLKLDLMHPSKRLWRRRLGSCRLGALEQQVLSLGREDDLPGSEAPARFFKYLETGDISLLDEVLVHNRLDILALGTLLIKLCEAYAEPERQLEVADLFSMGRAMERHGERELAERCYQMASQPRTVSSIRQLRDEQFAQQANLSLSMLKKRAGDYACAEKLWLGLAQRGQMGARPWVELSKLYEHQTKRLAKALDCANEALAAEWDPIERQKLELRIARLRRKITAQEEN